MSSNLNIEKIKKEKSGIDVLGDIFFHAIFGERISPENLERIKWYGIYPQDEKQKYFKLRIPLSMGELNLVQLKALSTISKKYSNNSLTFSSEQKIEFLDIKISNLPDIFNLLQEVKLNTYFEAGHTVRRVLTCPVNGIDDSQLFDVEPLANKLNETFVGNKNFDNLPNKLQFAISGYEEGCNVQFVPDVSFNAAVDSKDKIIFAIKILDNHIGFITPSLLVKTAISIANIYKDFGNREKLENSSFEYLVKNWGLNKFSDILNSTINNKIQKNIEIKPNTKARKPRMGINESKIEGQSYIGCKLDFKILQSSDLDDLTLLLEKYTASKIKVTHKANIIILDAPTENAKEFAKELKKINFNPFV